MSRAGSSPGGCWSASWSPSSNRSGSDERFKLAPAHPLPCGLARTCQAAGEFHGPGLPGRVHVPRSRVASGGAVDLSRLGRDLLELSLPLPYLGEHGCSSADLFDKPVAGGVPSPAEPVGADSDDVGVHDLRAPVQQGQVRSRIRSRDHQRSHDLEGIAWPGDLVNELRGLFEGCAPIIQVVLPVGPAHPTCKTVEIAVLIRVEPNDSPDSRGYYQDGEQDAQPQAPCSLKNRLEPDSGENQ